VELHVDHVVSDLSNTPTMITIQQRERTTRRSPPLRPVLQTLGNFISNNDPGHVNFMLDNQLETASVSSHDDTTGTRCRRSGALGCQGPELSYLGAFWIHLWEPCPLACSVGQGCKSVAVSTLRHPSNIDITQTTQDRVEVQLKQVEITLFASLHT
jgi:hypothetical protein